MRKVKLTKDVIIDKYHNGFTVFPKGTEIVVLRKWSESMLVCTCELIIDIEQPEEFLVGFDEIGED